METINILKALLELLDQATFNVNTRGSQQISGLVNAANGLVARLEAEEEAIDSAIEEVLEEVEDDS